MTQDTNSSCQEQRIAIDASDLVGGMSVESFNHNVREVSSRHFERALTGKQIRNLCNLELFQSLLSDTRVVPNVDLYQDGQLTRLSDRQFKSGKSTLEIVVERVRHGATIRLRDVDQFDQHLGLFASSVQKLFCADTQINIYLTPPGAHGFPPHFDTTDIFIVQCAGRKQWRLLDSYENEVTLPLPSITWDPNRFVPGPDGATQILEEGDVLYLPRGVMHEVMSLDRESMHLAVAIAPLTNMDLLTRAIQKAAETAPELRKRVAFEANLTSFDGLAESARGMVAAALQDVDMQEILQQARTQIMTDSPVADDSELREVLSQLCKAE